MRLPNLALNPPFFNGVEVVDIFEFPPKIPVFRPPPPAPLSLLLTSFAALPFPVARTPVPLLRPPAFPESKRRSTPRFKFDIERMLYPLPSPPAEAEACARLEKVLWEAVLFSFSRYPASSTARFRPPFLPDDIP